MTDPIITMTDGAIAHILKTIEKRGSGIGFRLAVKQTGCSGYMYVPEIIEEVKPQDIKIEVNDKLTVYIDPACRDLIIGTHIDFIKKGLGIEQLEFNNPNADSLCGCGESFNLKTEVDNDHDGD